MSEEQQEVIIGFTHTVGKVQIEFADGKFSVTEDVVTLLGGTDELAKIAGDLKEVNYADFMSGVGVEKMRQDLNVFQGKVISNHLFKNSSFKI